ncbi:MAG: hypothetical protein WKF87_08970 [Chryseolinea sp.]
MINEIKNKSKNLVRKIASFTKKAATAQIDQVMLFNQYRMMKKILDPSEMPSLKDVGFKVYSEFEEDGILLYIFSVVGTTNKRVVEICVGDGIECMAANLIVNHGWEGLLFDGNKKQVEAGIDFYASHPLTLYHPPIFKHAWITKDNVNELIGGSGFIGEIDLLSVDMDGNDYYIMEAIHIVKPRVIICETHNIIPSDLALTIPYKADFNRSTDLHREFMSVSLLGMQKLLNRKGYRLIGSHRHGFNAIFMLNEIGRDYFPEVSIQSVHDNPYTKLRTQTAWKEVKDLPWVQI